MTDCQGWKSRLPTWPLLTWLQLLFSLLLGYSSFSPLAREQVFLRTSFCLLCWHFTGCDVFSSTPGTYELKSKNSGELITVFCPLGPFVPRSLACLPSSLHLSESSYFYFIYNILAFYLHLAEGYLLLYRSVSLIFIYSSKYMQTHDCLYVKHLSRS